MAEEAILKPIDSLSGIESMTSWYGLYYQSQRIPGLPRVMGLGSRGTFTLDYAGEEDKGSCLDLLEGCRERGDNVPVDQFRDDEDSGLLFHMSQVFTICKVKDETSESLERGSRQRKESCISALIVIQPALISRTMDKCLAHIHIFTNESLSRDQHVNDDLVELAVTLTSQLDLGYTRCITNVAAGLSTLLTSYRRQGFLVVVTVPEGVKLRGQGVSDDLILTKSLGQHRQRRDPAHIAALCLRIAEQSRSFLDSPDCGMRPVPFLPKPYVFHTGLEVIVRELKVNEAEIIYEIWKKAAEKGQGYGLDECPTLDMFKLTILADHYCVVLEDRATKDLVGLSCITDSWYTRNPNSKFVESNLIISERYRGKGLGTEAIHLELSLAKQLGYVANLNDILLSNSTMDKALKRNAVQTVTIGVIPDGTYTAGLGWDDQMIVLTDFRQSNLVQNFLETAEKSLSRKSRPTTSLTESKL